MCFRVVFLPCIHGSVLLESSVSLGCLCVVFPEVAVGTVVEATQNLFESGAPKGDRKLGVSVKGMLSGSTVCH